MNISEIMMKIKDEYGIDVNDTEIGGFVVILKHDGPENEFTATHVEAFEGQMGTIEFNVKKETQYLSPEQVEMKKAQEAQIANMQANQEIVLE